MKRKHVVDYCAECDEPIYEEDKFIVAGDKIICEWCVSEMDSDDWIKTLNLEWQEAHYFEIAVDRE